MAPGDRRGTPHPMPCDMACRTGRARAMTDVRPCQCGHVHSDATTRHVGLRPSPASTMRPTPVDLV